MEKTLYSLIELQEIDLKLDKVTEERGDLPSIVEKLQLSLNEKKQVMQEQKDKIKELKVESGTLETELGVLKEKMKKYEGQLYQVKTNKEYDAIANETENVKQKIQEIENKIISDVETSETLDKSNTEIAAEIEKLESDFSENDAELKEKISASSEEENLLKQEREIVKKRLTQQQIISYERIRNAKKGIAVAYCNGGVCSGCFSFLPPQKVVEIRSMKQLFQCESCGRIMVWDKNQE